jgi:RNA polymerase sigma factor (sigma-70 family)
MINNPELLESYRNGEQNAFLHIYNKYASSLRKFLQGGFSFSSQGRIFRYKGVDAAMDVESIVQETFARAFVASTRASYDGERPFQTYLFSIAKNLVLRECHHRERVIHVERIEDSVEPIVNNSMAFDNATSISPEIYVQNLQLEALIEGFITSLNEEEKQFFSWRFAQGETQESTASKMGTTRARIKLLEKNMRKRFLEMLRKNGYLVEHRVNPRWKRKERAEISVSTG